MRSVFLLMNLSRDQKGLMTHLMHWSQIKIFYWNFFKNPTMFPQLT
uniref:Uncharacterized protein n=1 Tax=Arundo donax TaxID=35708 RepID=A0A0A9D388_ARUDO